MSDANVHVATHPSGHPNKTAVNAENPIFGRPADPVPEVSVEQAGVVQSDKHARETVVSPLINEEQLSPAVVEDAAGKEGVEPVEAAQDSTPSAADLDAVADEHAAVEATGDLPPAA